MRLRDNRVTTRKRLAGGATGLTYEVMNAEAPGEKPKKEVDPQMHSGEGDRLVSDRVHDLRSGGVESPI